MKTRRFRLDATSELARKWAAEGLDVVDFGDVHWVRDGDQYFGSTDSDSAEVEQFVGMAGCHAVRDAPKPATPPAGGGRFTGKPGHGNGDGGGRGRSGDAPGQTGEAGKSGDAPGHTGELPPQSHGKGTPGGPEDPGESGESHGKAGEEHGKATAPGQGKKHDG